MRVFISYAREIEEVAKSIEEDLRALRHEVWVDHLLTGGQDWWETILSQIRACDVFLFAISRDSLASAACTTEYRYATDLRKLILPVIVAKNVREQSLPADLGSIQTVRYALGSSASTRDLIRAMQNLPSVSPLPEPLPDPPEAPISKSDAQAAMRSATAYGAIRARGSDFVRHCQAHLDRAVQDGFVRIRLSYPSTKTDAGRALIELGALETLEARPTGSRGSKYQITPLGVDVLDQLSEE